MKNNPIQIEKMWDQFSKMAMPKVEKDSSQFVVSKKVFVAGIAQALFLFEEIIGSADVTEDQGVQILEDVLKQCREELERPHGTEKEAG